MTVVNNNNLIEKQADAIRAQSSNPFGNIGKYLDNKFKNVFSIEATTAIEKNNPFSQLTETQAVENVKNVSTREYNNHSDAYNANADSIFGTQASNNQAFTENFRSEKHGTLDFNS
ncbi:MAG: hypothetical protein PHV37_09735 [Candidatus Gastranaerophilales bacterium]|nr:hypothetical protein [Candidatus Gastranaerophilales bacterium]